MVSILLLYYGRKSKQSYERYLPARTSGGPELPDSVTCVFSSTSHGTEGIRAVGFRMAYTETHAGARYHTLNTSLLPQRINRATGVNPWVPRALTSLHRTPLRGVDGVSRCMSLNLQDSPCVPRPHNFSALGAQKRAHKIHNTLKDEQYISFIEHLKGAAEKPLLFCTLRNAMPGAGICNAAWAIIAILPLHTLYWHALCIANYPRTCATPPHRKG